MCSMFLLQVCNIPKGYKGFSGDVPNLGVYIPIQIGYATGAFD
jgi:hypothetical protein